MKYSGGKVVTATQRLLVYLIDYRTYEGEIDGPIEITQTRIAEAVGITVGNVPRTVRPLMKDGRVQSHKVHVPGIRQKRRIYYLTLEGRKKARVDKEKISGMTITYKDKSGKEQELSIGGILDIAPSDIRIIDILRETEEGMFDHNLFLERQYQADRMFVDPSRKFSEPRYFFGRSRELEQISDFCDSSTSRTLIIKGMPGIGKTTLIAKMLLDAQAGVDVYCQCLQAWTTPRALLRQLSGFLAECGKPELKKYIDANMDIDLAEVEYLLTEALSKNRYTLVFDDFHNASPEVVDVFTMLQSVIANQDGIKIVVIGRKVEPFYDKREVAVKKQIMEMAMGGLDRDDSMSLAREVKVPEDLIDIVHEQTAGHPLFIELLSQGRAFPKQDIEDFIVDEFTKMLGDDELELLKFISVFRFPVQKRVFRTRQPTLIRLVKHSILTRSNDDFIRIHDVLKDSFYAMLSKTELEEFHSQAAEHYLESSAASNLVEALVHLLWSEQYSAAVDIISDKGEGLLKSGKVEDLSKILASLLSKDIEITEIIKANLFILQGTALSFLGEWDKAIDHFGKAIKGAKGKEGEAIKMRAILETGKILLKRNEYSKAKPIFDKVLNWATKTEEMKMTSESHYMLGSLNERQADLDTAQKHFQNSMKISKDMNDLEQIAQAQYGLGRVYHREHKFDKALDSKSKALDIALQIGDEHTAAKILTSNGWTFTELERFGEAIEAHKRAIDLARKSGAVRVLAYALSNIGAVYIDKPDLISSSNNLNEASELFEKLGEKRMVATVKLNIAIVTLLRGNSGDPSELFKECTAILDGLKDKSKLMSAYFKFGQTLHKVDSFVEAQRFFKKALQLSKDIGDDTASEQILQEIQNLDI